MPGDVGLIPGQEDPLEKEMATHTSVLAWEIQMVLRKSISRRYGLEPTRLFCPWESPGKNTGVGCHFFLQGIFLTRDQTQVSHIAGGFFTI